MGNLLVVTQYFDVFDFHLSEAEMERIKTIDAGQRIGADPDTFIRP